MDEWYIYLVICSDQTIYTGIAKNVAKRIEAHNTKKTGAKYTKTRRPVKLLKSFGPFSKSEASKLEYSIKQMSRKQKLEL